MYYSFYQKKTFEYVFNKYKFGKKKIYRNDTERLNLKGKVKNYKIVSDNKIITEYEFNESGFIIVEINPNEYYLNEFNSDNKLTERTVYNISDKKIRSEHFIYNNQRKLTRRNVENDINYNLGYDEFYEYDLRGNTTAIIKQNRNYIDEVETFKYNFNAQMTDHYLYNKSSKNYIGRFKFSYDDFLINEKYFSDENKLLTSKTSILDINGNPIQILKNTVFMNVQSIKNYLYTYDNFKNWVTKDITFNGKQYGKEIAMIEYYEK